MLNQVILNSQMKICVVFANAESNHQVENIFSRIFELQNCYFDLYFHDCFDYLNVLPDQLPSSAYF